MVKISEGEIGLCLRLTIRLKPQALHRLEVITGTGRRRGRCGFGDCAPSWLSPQQLFGWRRQARQPASASTETSGPLFVPALVEAALPERAVRRRGRNRPLDEDRVAGIIEVEIGSVTVRVGRGADARTVTAVSVIFITYCCLT